MARRTAHKSHPDPPEAVRAAVASSSARGRSAALFEAYVIIASAFFLVLAVTAHYVPYFGIDLKITRAMQSYHGAPLELVMRGLTWLGFFPQVHVIVGGVILLLFLLGLRWEAMVTAFAGAGTIVGSIIKLIVYRPRPSGDLIDSLGKLNTYSFPSGHVLMASCFYGFLAFLVFTLLKPSWIRAALLVLIGLVIGLMGPSRIYLGQHWFSDVVGAYVLGSLWLALTIHMYRWGKRRFFRDQPTAPEKPVPAGRRASPP